MGAVKNIKSAGKGVLKRAYDGWTNVASGLNIRGQDKNASAEVNWQKTDRATADAYFAGDGIGKKIAVLPPKDMVREGVTWKFDEDDTQKDTVNETIKFLTEEYDRLNIWAQFAWGQAMGRVYGGALGLMVVDDSLDMDKPLMLSRVRRLKAIQIIDRWSLTVNSGDINTKLGDPNFGKPDQYRYQAGSDIGVAGPNEVIIHHSRVIRFDGERLTQRLYIENNFWHDSIYGKLSGPIRNYSASHDSIASIIPTINQAVFSIDGLNEALAANKEALIIQKLNFVNLMRSSINAVILDKTDLFQTQGAAVQGAKDLLDKTDQRLTAVSDIPHTRLLGESPGASLGEGGRSELTDYYDDIAAQQELVFRDKVKRVTEVIFAQTEEQITEPKNWSFTFNPLNQDDRQTETTNRKTQADTDAIYMDNDVLDAEEVRSSRFGSGEYSFETRIQDRDETAFNSEDDKPIEEDDNGDTPVEEKDPKETQGG